MEAKYYESDRYRESNDEMNHRVDDLWREGYDEELAYFGRQCSEFAASEFKDMTLKSIMIVAGVWAIFRGVPHIIKSIRSKNVKSDNDEET